MITKGVRAALNTLRYRNVSFRSIVLGNVELASSASIGPNCFVKAETESRIIIEENVDIEKGCKLFALNGGEILIRDGATIKKGTTVLPHEDGYGGKVEIGSDSVIHYRNRLDLTGNIKIGPYVTKGEHTYFHRHTHITDNMEHIWDRKPETETIVVGEGCWIGTMCQLMPSSARPAHSVLTAGGIATENMMKRVFLMVSLQKLNNKINVGNKNIMWIS